eukprot:scaffold9783_cov127-Isochrysis_galbana.AAC.2
MARHLRERPAAATAQRAAGGALQRHFATTPTDLSAPIVRPARTHTVTSHSASASFVPVGALLGGHTAPDDTGGSRCRWLEPMLCVSASSSTTVTAVVLAIPDLRRPPSARASTPREAAPPALSAKVEQS